MSPRTALVVVAHPDDAELSCGGTVVRWVEQGWSAYLVVATDGARGGKEIGSDFAIVMKERQAEQRQAADVLGFKDVIHLRFPDGELEENADLRGALVEQIRRLQPERVITLDPLTVILQNSYVNHRDHRILGMALLDAMYPEASNAGFFPEQIEQGLQPHKVTETWLANTEAPNWWVDVSSTLERRFEALRRHASQIRLWPDNGEGVIREQRRTAELAGLRYGVRYAEEYRRVIVNPLS